MKILAATILLSFFACISSQELQNYVGTELQKCLTCVCHSRTGCFNRLTCARYSINFTYWETAGSPTLDSAANLDTQNKYKTCMSSENCILATLDGYATAIGHLDCNCDGEFDCKDRLAIHLFGADCMNPNFTAMKAERYNRCIKNLDGFKEMEPEEGFDGCTLEVF